MHAGSKSTTTQLSISNLLLQTTPRIPSPKPSQSITIDSNIFYPLYLNHMPIPLIQWLMLSPFEDP